MYSISERVRKVRIDSGLTQHQFADKTGLSYRTVQEIERKRLSVSKASMLKITNSFKSLSLKWLESGEGEMYEFNTNSIDNNTLHEHGPQTYGITKDDIGQVFLGYFNEIEIIKDLLNNKQDSYRQVFGKVRNSFLTTQKLHSKS